MTGVPVALISHRPILMDGLRRAFALDQGFHVAIQGGSASDILPILNVHAPALIVLDLPQDDLFSALAIINRLSLKTRSIVFSEQADVAFAVTMLNAGASAYILAKSTTGELLKAARLVMEGETFLSPSIATEMALALQLLASRKAFASHRHLNVREEEIIGHLLNGKTNKVIASSLGLSEKTVKHHMTVLMNKLQVKNRLELVMMIKAFESHARAAHP